MCISGFSSVSGVDFAIAMLEIYLGELQVEDALWCVCRKGVESSTEANSLSLLM